MENSIESTQSWMNVNFIIIIIIIMAATGHQLTNHQTDELIQFNWFTAPQQQQLTRHSIYDYYYYWHLYIYVCLVFSDLG